ncbi:MAG: branched-chain amino acid ABC transporter permease, partial [Deinococcales bacterium]
MRAWQALLGVGGAALLVALPWLLPPFYANLLCFIAIYGGVATGLILLTGYAGLVSLGQGAFYGIGAYGAVVLAGSYGVDPWLSLLLGTLLAATAGYLVGLPILRLSGHYLALATLAWGIIATILFTQLASITGGPNGFTHVPVLSLFGLDFIDPGHFYYLTLVFAVLAVAALASLIRSRAGRAVRAMRSSEAAAASVGMEVGRIKLQVFVLAAALAGLGGALFAYFIAFISPSAFDLGASIRLLTMAMIGGAHPLGEGRGQERGQLQGPAPVIGVARHGPAGGVQDGDGLHAGLHGHGHHPVAQPAGPLVGQERGARPVSRL